jgi:hypothetical protein
MNIGLLIKQSGFSKSCDGTDSHVGDYEDFERLTKAIRAEALKEAEEIAKTIGGSFADEFLAAIRGLK